MADITEARKTLEIVKDRPELNEGGTIMAAVGEAIDALLDDHETLKENTANLAQAREEGEKRLIRLQDMHREEHLRAEQAESALDKAREEIERLKANLNAVNDVCCTAMTRIDAALNICETYTMTYQGPWLDMVIKALKGER